jgi:ATP-dependent protease ClpP protease subunit
MAADVMIIAEELARNRRRIDEIYSYHTGQMVENISKALDR